VIVYDHCFVTDCLWIDVHIASQKMFRLGIVGTAEHFLNKNLSTACRGEDPKNDAQQEEERQKSGSVVRSFLR
jgi:hypothetical protein